MTQAEIISINARAEFNKNRFKVIGKRKSQRKVINELKWDIAELKFCLGIMIAFSVYVIYLLCEAVM